MLRKGFEKHILKNGSARSPAGLRFISSKYASLAVSLLISVVLRDGRGGGVQKEE